jgi:uncharacterized protein (TIGR04141 family)
LKLSFYLFDSSVTDFSTAIDSAKLEGDDPFQEIAIVGNLGFQAKAYLQPNRQTPPKWINFFGDHLELPDNLYNTTNSLLFLIKVRDRVFAVTAGSGFSAVNRTRIEPNFGLRVTLNAIDPEKLKGLDSRRIDNRATQRRVLVSSESHIGDFDFDLDEDMISLVSESPRNGALARRLAGADSLSLTGDYALSDLGAKCEALLDAFNSDAYRTHFEFIDHLRLEKDASIRDGLNQALADALSNRQKDKLLLAYPEIDFWTKAERYKVTANRGSTEIEDVTLDEVYKALDARGIERVDPNMVRIIGLDEDGNAVTLSRTLFDYAVFERQYNGGTYLLSMRKWFRIADSYLAEVDEAIQNIDQIDNAAFLPPIEVGQKEAEYNLAAANSDRLCLDKNLFTGLPGTSSVEVCDLLTRQREFIVVKRYNGSSTLSHMFAQALVSAELFNDLRQYREFVTQQVPNDWPVLFDVDTPDKRAISFVYAIAGASGGELVNVLPFFSKVNLRHSVRAIKRMNFQVKVCLVPLDSDDSDNDN